MMWMEVAWIFLLMHCFAHSYPLSSSIAFGKMFDPEQEWDELVRVIASETAQEFAPNAKLWKGGLAGLYIPEAKRVPVYRRVPADEVRTEVFKPEKGARSMPESAEEMLRATAGPATTAGASRPELIETLCYTDRIYVRLQKQLFNSIDADKYLKLGSCLVNNLSKNHYYLLYLLENDCGFQKLSNADDFTISTEVSFHPDATSPIMREQSFIVPIQCKYHRFFNSYTPGFYPKLLGGTVSKRLNAKTGIILIALDASGNERPAGLPFTMGQAMCFEAKLSDPASTAQRLYVNMCVMTTSQEPNSTTRYTVINNQGCMMDGMSSWHSKFVTQTLKTTQQFCIGAFIFRDIAYIQDQQQILPQIYPPEPIVQQIYMHCEISLGDPTSTEGTKACNYYPDSETWGESSGDDVCSCCSSSCSPAQPRAFKTMVSSHPWEIEYHQKSSPVEPGPQFKAYGTEDYADFENLWDEDF